MSGKDDFPRWGLPEDRVPDETGLEVKDHIIEEVEGPDWEKISEVGNEQDAAYRITVDEGFGFILTLPFLHKNEILDTPPPASGDRVRVWTVRWSDIVGIALRGKVVKFRTLKEHEAMRRQEIEAERETRRREYLDHGKDDLDRRIAELPVDFRRRILKYTMPPGDSDWGWEYGPYEVFCCEQAAIYGERAKGVIKNGEDSIREAVAYWDGKLTSGAVKEKPPTFELAWLTWWNALGSVDFADAVFDGKSAAERRNELMPGHSDEHSGNTYGIAYRLALIWLRPEPAEESGGEGVFKMHGALAAIGGSDDYGDPRDERELRRRWRVALQEIPE